MSGPPPCPPLPPAASPCLRSAYETVELLKLRFGEESLQDCAVMVRRPPPASTHALTGAPCSCETWPSPSA